MVPSRNEASNISRFLRAVPAAVSVLLVDASVDDTCAVARRARRENLRIVRDGGRVAAARQLGADLSATDWILFSDADVEFSRDYLERLALLRPGERLGAVVGAKLSLDRYAGYYRAFSAWLGLLCRLGLPAASGSNLLVRRSALLEIGGFDPDLSCNEDGDLVWRLRRSGYEVRYAAGLAVYEFDHRRLDAGLFRKTVHSLARGALLDLGLLTPARKRADWGYWAGRDGGRALAPAPGEPRPETIPGLTSARRLATRPERHRPLA